MQKQRNPKRFLRRDHNPFLLKIVPQISDLHRFIFCFKKICVICEICGSFFHRISRMNRKSFLLIGLLRIFADIWPLANGWRPKYSLIVFVTQISQMTQIFLRGSFLSHRFHRLHRFFFVEVFFVPQISQMTQIFLRGTFSILRGYL